MSFPKKHQQIIEFNLQINRKFKQIIKMPQNVAAIPAAASVRHQVICHHHLQLL